MAKRRSYEEALVQQESDLLARLKMVRKRLQIHRIRASAKRRKGIFASIRRNEREVLDALQKRSPALYKKLVLVVNTVSKAGGKKK